MTKTCHYEIQCHKYEIKCEIMTKKIQDEFKLCNEKSVITKRNKYAKK